MSRHLFSGTLARMVGSGMAPPRLSLPARLRQSSPLVGTLITLDSPEMAEIMAGCGFEWLLADGEHSPLLDCRAIARLAQAAQPAAYLVARTPSADRSAVSRALETGCDGLVIAGIEDEATAHRVVAEVKYPPAGRRNLGLARAQGYGATLHNYLEEANRDVAIVLQVSNIETVGAVDRLVAVDGVDALFIDPFHLAGSIGRPGDLNHPDLKEAIARVRRACLEAERPLGLYTSVAEASSGLIDGARMIALGADVDHLLRGARAALAAVTGRNRLLQTTAG